MTLVLATVKKKAYLVTDLGTSQGLDFTILSVRSHLNRPFTDSFKKQDWDN